MVDPVEAAAEPKSAKGESRIEELTRQQRTIARRTAESRATVPDLELTTEVDMSACLELAASHGTSVTAALLRACALALREFPKANGTYRDGQFELYSRVNIGVAVPTDGAYTIPTVFDADEKSLEDVGREIEALGQRALAGELLASDLSGATFTLTDLGSYGVTSATTVITPSQAAAIAAGAVREVPVVRDAAIVPGHSMTMTLACDHRILYAADAAGFLMRVKELLEAAAI
jgi:pyruvate dehydrogenase E2 component (dihydrolipoamide acetyltransferase)